MDDLTLPLCFSLPHPLLPTSTARHVRPGRDAPSGPSPVPGQRKPAFRATNCARFPSQTIGLPSRHGQAGRPGTCVPVETTKASRSAPFCPTKEKGLEDLAGGKLLGADHFCFTVTALPLHLCPHVCIV